MSERDLDRIFSREAPLVEQYAAMDKLKVGLTGISPGAGVSFLTGCLARFLANTGKHSPAVVELGRGTLFDSYGMDRRFAGRPYFRFFQELAENRSVRGMRNMDEGINWILQSPEESEVSLSFEQKLRLIGYAAGDVVLCDLSGDADPDQKLLRSMDQIIAVIDPLPSGMLKGYRRLCGLKALETAGCSIIYVISKMNGGVNRRQMHDFLKIKKPVLIPLVSPEHIYTAEYNCKSPYAIREVKAALQGPLGEIASTLLFSQ